MILKIALSVLNIWLWLIAYKILNDNQFMAQDAIGVGCYFSFLIIAISIWIKEIKNILP